MTDQIRPTPQPLTLGHLQSLRKPAAAPLSKLAKAMPRAVKSLLAELQNYASVSPALTYEGYQCGGRDMSEDYVVGEDENDHAFLRHHQTGACLKASYERSLIFALCELCFGGAGHERPYNESRPLSRTERKLAEVFCQALTHSLPQAFDEPTQHHFSLLTPEELAEQSIAAMFKPDVTLRLLYNAQGYSSEILLEVPQAIADHFRLPSADQQQLIPQANWPQHMLQQLGQSHFTLQARLIEFDISLEHLTALERGQVLPLPVALSDMLYITCGAQEILAARLGQSAGKFCLSIDHRLTSHRQAL